MTATDASAPRAVSPARSLTDLGAGLVDSFRWALEVRRRCDAHSIRDRLDGEAIREILAAVERERT